MKKLFALILALLMVLSLAACGGNKKNIVGTWQIVDEATATEYGLGIEFTKDGKLRYGLTEDLLLGLAGEEADAEEVEEVMEGLDFLMTIEYKIKSDTVMELTAKALLGLVKEKTEVEYKLDGDKLTFDGATYSRVK